MDETRPSPARPTAPELQLWGSATLPRRSWGWGGDFSLHNIPGQAAVRMSAEGLALEVWTIPFAGPVPMDEQPSAPRFSLEAAGQLARTGLGYCIGPVRFSGFDYTVVVERVGADVRVEMWSEPPRTTGAAQSDAVEAIVELGARRVMAG